MICKDCALTADENRRRWDIGHHMGLMDHPENCHCECMHKIGAWEDFFSIERPQDGTTEDSGDTIRASGDNIGTL